MKHNVNIIIDCGETTCDGCEYKDFREYYAGEHNVEYCELFQEYHIYDEPHCPRCQKCLDTCVKVGESKNDKTTVS